MHATLQGADLPPDDETPTHKGDDDLPPELLEMERLFREEKAKAQEASGQMAPGLGYVVE